MSATSVEFCAKVAVAVEISGAKWMVGSFAGTKLRRKVLEDKCAAARLAALCEEVRTAASKLGGEGAHVVVAYEAGHEGFWIQRALAERGFQAEVIDPVSLKVDRRSKRAKTDRLDAEALTRALYAWMQGDTTALRMVRSPSRSDEDDREWQRARDRLRAERRSCLDRIGKKLRTHSIWAWDRASLRAGTLRDIDGRPLGRMLQITLLMDLDRAELVERKLQELEAYAGQMSERSRECIERLMQFRGIGEVGARGLTTKLYWRDFSNRREVGGCTGLVGMPYDSGRMRQDQGISKQGDPSLRALLVELAWLWLRYQPGSAITKWFRERAEGQNKRHKRTLIVAVARRLAIAWWRYLKDGQVPEGAILAPG
jgi:transposase